MDESARTAEVSVALCTYQGAPFVAEQVWSILAQTRPVAQLVIADDGSTDGTPQLAADAVAAFARAHRSTVSPVVTVLPPR